ncbi:MAG: hypothetical protein PHW25_17390 [Zoogloea sp.]|uniref:hypothetical protein n=1 Tax=Zoogloea sp. TaxID=49181 RepID=UPI00262DC7D2|nr:hypothetical protein [Zoogloea sp.]MDD3328858.1 hypothetical protein [Zoogloea sp.]
MAWIHRTIIAPAPYAAAAGTACEQLAGAGGSGMFTTPLSPTGELPATHYISSGLIEQDFADLLANPDALAAVATQAGLDPAPLVAIIAASDITDEPAEAALARLGLQMCRGAEVE